MDLETEADLRGQQAALEFAIIEIARELKSSGLMDLPKIMRLSAFTARRDGELTSVKRAMLDTLERLADGCEEE